MIQHLQQKYAGRVAWTKFSTTSIPEEAMRTDALMQALLARRWTRTVLVVGPKPEDEAFAVCCAVRVDAPGITIVSRPAGRPGEKLAALSPYLEAYRKQLAGGAA